jgi:uncharacterized protein YdeI (YjbR/CyaY-like superfamily)
VEARVNALRFRAVLQGVDGSSATFVSVPAAIMKRFGGRTRVPVAVTIEGVTHRTTICNMGMGPMVGIPAAIRKATGKKQGDRLNIQLRVDEAERTVEVPRDFAAAMSAAQRRAYDRLSFTHRKEYVLWIEEAKRPETRARRIEKAREMLRQKGSST